MGYCNICGDQFYTFTENSLKNHLVKNNFIPKVFNINGYENTMLISKKISKLTNRSFKKDFIKKEVIKFKI